MDSKEGLERSGISADIGALGALVSQDSFKLFLWDTWWSWKVDKSWAKGFQNNENRQLFAS